MFQFPPLALHTYVFSMQFWGITPRGLSHSEIPGSKTVSVSPRLIAGNHVLLRLLVPRHPPCALSNFTVNFIITQIKISFEIGASGELLKNKKIDTWLLMLLLILQEVFQQLQRIRQRTRCALMRSAVCNGLEPSCAPRCSCSAAKTKTWSGPDRVRTDDLLNANQALSQLSYRPKHMALADVWAWVELNYRPHAYQACALTT